jgi:hypothetical protein
VVVHLLKKYVAVSNAESLSEDNHHLIGCGEISILIFRNDETRIVGYACGLAPHTSKRRYYILHHSAQMLTMLSVAYLVVSDNILLGIPMTHLKVGSGQS